MFSDLMRLRSALQLHNFEFPIPLRFAITAPQAQELMAEVGVEVPMLSVGDRFFLLEFKFIVVRADHGD